MIILKLFFNSFDYLFYVFHNKRYKLQQREFVKKCKILLNSLYYTMLDQLKKLQFWIMQRQASYNDHIEMNTIVSQAIQALQNQNQKVETLEKTKTALEEKIEKLEEKITLLENK